MLDIKFIRENPDVVKENIKKKFQDEKLPLVDKVIGAGRARTVPPFPRHRSCGLPAEHPVQADRQAHGHGQEGPQQAGGG